MAVAVTGRLAANVTPVMKTESALAAIAEAAILLPPVKVMKTGLRLGSNRATKDWVEASVRLVNAAPTVAARMEDVVVR